MDVAARLTELAADKSTGQLEVNGPAGVAHVIVRDAGICSVQILTGQPTLAKRLVSTGRLTLVGFGAAVRVHQEHPQIGLGEALVRMGLVTRPDVEAAQREQICDDIATILSWPGPEVSFHTGATATTPPPTASIDEVLRTAAARSEQLRSIEQAIGGPLAVPAPAEAASTGQIVSLQPADWAVLCRVDGQRTLATIADQTGLTRLEVGEVLRALVDAGLVSVTAPDSPPPPVAQPVPLDAPPLAQPVALDAPSAPVIHLAEPPRDALPASGPAAAANSGPPPASDALDDPAELLRELSQLSLGSDPVANPRRGR